MIRVHLRLDPIKGIMARVDSNIFQHPPVFEVSGNCHIQKEMKYNPIMSRQWCELIVLVFDPECTDFRNMDLNVIK